MQSLVMFTLLQLKNTFMKNYLQLAQSPIDLYLQAIYDEQILTKTKKLFQITVKMIRPYKLLSIKAPTKFHNIYENIPTWKVSTFQILHRFLVKLDYSSCKL